MDRSLPFAELKRCSHINERANLAADISDFSNAIRVGLPGFARKTPNVERLISNAQLRASILQFDVQRSMFGVQCLLL